MLEHTQSPFKSLQWCPRHQKLLVKHEWLLWSAKIGFFKWDCYTTIYITLEADLCCIYDAGHRFLIGQKLSKIVTSLHLCFLIESLASLALISPCSKIALALKRHLELLKSHYIHPTYPNTSFSPTESPSSPLSSSSPPSPFFLQPQLVPGFLK